MGNTSPHPAIIEDSDDLEERIESIKELGDEELNDLMEETLVDMNLSDKRKEPIRSFPTSIKKKMLIMHMNRLKIFGNLDKPEDYVNCLSNPAPDMKSGKILSCLKSLRIALTTNPVSWVEEFGSNGLKGILSILKISNRDGFDDDEYECIRCLKALMNNAFGLREMFSQKEALAIVAGSLDVTKQQVMLETLKVLAGICLVQPDGHEKVIEAITLSAELTGKQKFEPIVQSLSVEDNEPLRVAALKLINAIVSSPDHLEFRIHLRHEFIRVGLIEAINVLEKDASEDLSLELKIFTEDKKADYEGFYKEFVMLTEGVMTF